MLADQKPPMKDRPAAAGSPSLLGFLRSRQLWTAVAGVAAAALIAFFLVTAGLKWYTRHGQRLEVGDYEDMAVAEAKRAIERSDFRVRIVDSVFLVDEQPGIVLRQDPAAGAFVKEDRRIYLTITKTIPDEVELPPLTGTYDFDRYRRKLNLLDVEGRVRDRVYSSKYSPNTILKVYYEGREVPEAELKRGYSVPKGSTLEFTVTSKQGGMADLPDLRCRTVDEARFYLENYRLRLGRVQADATVSNPELAYVWRQDPPFAEGARLPFDAEVNLYVTARAPADCDL